MNYTDRETPYTRIIEHKHFEFGKQPVTYITREYPASWKRGDEAYYPVNNKKNQDLYKNMLIGQKLKRTSYLAVDWENINIMIWIKSQPPHFVW